MQRIDEIALQPDVLIACDFDGTLAPIVEHPDDVRPVRESLVALRTLSEEARAHVAVVSGRALHDLAARVALPESVHLVGSHGSEFDVGFARRLSRRQEEDLKRLHEVMMELAASHRGFIVETKPASVAFHYRNAPTSEATRAVERLHAALDEMERVHIKAGKMVLEAGVVPMDKGTAIQSLRQRLGVSAVLFVGDDTTDEAVFRTLSGPDVAIKVGPGETAAKYRVEDTNEVAMLLARIAEERMLWVCGGRDVPIAHHAMLSDQRTCALVTPDARITWLCLPRIDSPALFAELLGGPEAGYFSVAPGATGTTARQRYLDRTMTLETTFGDLTVTDYLDCSGHRHRQRPGRSDLMRTISGSGSAVIEFAPRLDFGRTSTRLRVLEEGIEVLDCPEPIVLHAPGVSWSVERRGAHETAVARVNVRADQPLTLSLRYGVRSLRPTMTSGASRQQATDQYWSRWTEELTLPGVADDLVLRSALTLRGLVHGPTGAICAAATTSLPETIGGVRNWDYRYCWPRDAAVAATALVKLGSQGEALHFLDWLLAVIERAHTPDRISPLYTVEGGELPAEAEIRELSGYAGSRPVRTGNAAARQIQLDVFGPIGELIYELARRDAPLAQEHWRVIEAMVSAVRTRWRDPDHGIWEFRMAAQHHVHSKVMCWLTIDRAIGAAEIINSGAPADWKDLRHEIARDVLEHGWNESLGYFTAAYENDEVDAASLWVGLSGLLPPDDPRNLDMIRAVERELLRGAGVYRYRYDDGLPGTEGAFHLCTCWLILAYLASGQRDRARDLFEAFIALAGPTGLMSEEYGVSTRRSLGNHPQAYTHAGLIECAIALSSIP